jgi:ribosomal protein S8
MRLSFIKFLAKWKNTDSSTNMFFVQKLSKFDIINLHILCDAGFLFGFKNIKKNWFKIFPKKNIKVRVYYHPNKPIFVEYNSLLKLKSNYQILFISTSYGIKHHLWCLKNKIGGILLYSVA